MTNTGDFRRYSYANDASYALEYFSVQRSSAAPKYAPTPSRQRGLKVRENKGKKSTAVLVQEQRASRKQIAVIIGVAVLCFAMLACSISTFALKNELTHQISRLETDLSISKSENTRINSELDALVSMNMIDQYAVEELGMTKMKVSQIKYIDVAQYKENRLAQQEKAEKVATQPVKE